MTAVEPLDPARLAAIKARDAAWNEAPDKSGAWSIALDRRALLAEVERLQEQANQDALNAADDAARIDQLETQVELLQAQQAEALGEAAAWREGWDQVMNILVRVTAERDALGGTAGDDWNARWAAYLRGRPYYRDGGAP